MNRSTVLLEPGTRIAPLTQSPLESLEQVADVVALASTQLGSSTQAGSQFEPAEAEPPHLEALAVEKAYAKGKLSIPVLHGVNVSVRRGDFVSIIGQSGSGKSTLMHLLGLLDAPDAGQIQLCGQRIDDLPARARDTLRNRTFGFIFQFYHLLPELSVLENVLSPMMIRYSMWSYWRQRKELRDRAGDLLSRVGLGHRLKHRPSELSGGEMQRAAIARALIGQPEILLADEPTGNLDSRTGREIMDVLNGLNGQNGLTIIMVTHDEAIAREAHRIVRLAEGRLEGLPAGA